MSDEKQFNSPQAIHGATTDQKYSDSGYHHPNTIITASGQKVTIITLPPLDHETQIRIQKLKEDKIDEVVAKTYYRWH